MPAPAPYVGGGLPGKVVEVIVEGLYTEGPSGGAETVKTANVFHYAWNLSGVFATPTHAAFDAAFELAVGDLIEAALSARWTHVQNRVRWLDDPTDAYFDYAKGTAGAIAGDCLPPRNAVYIKLGTGYRGRNFLGSKHFGPIAESDTTGTELVTPTPTWWTNLKTAVWSATVTPATFNTYLPVVLSPSLSQMVTEPTSIVCAPMTVAYMRRNLGQMKRRAPVSTVAA